MKHVSAVTHVHVNITRVSCVDRITVYVLTDLKGHSTNLTHHKLFTRHLKSAG